MGSGASTFKGDEINFEEYMTHNPIPQPVITYIQVADTVQSGDFTSEFMSGLSSDSLKAINDFQRFLESVKNDTIHLEEADQYVSKFPASLFATQREGKTAIQLAGENRNIPLFHLLIQRKTAARREYHENLASKEQRFGTVYCMLNTLESLESQ